jgi:hypothetical protein
MPTVAAKCHLAFVATAALVDKEVHALQEVASNLHEGAETT